MFLKHRTNVISRNLTRQTKTSQQSSNSGERERGSQRRNAEELRSEKDTYIHTGMHANEEKEGKKPNQKNK
jgi:hypothetical protein